MNSSMPENRGSTVSHIPGCITINIETLGCDEERWSQNHVYKGTPNLQDYQLPHVRISRGWNRLGRSAIDG